MTDEQLIKTLEQVREKIRKNPQNKFSLFRIVLIFNENRWHFLHAQIILTRKEMREKEHVLYQSKDILIAEIPATVDYAFNFTYALSEDTCFIDPTLTKGKLKEVEIRTFTKVISDGHHFLDSNQAKARGIYFPVDEIRIRGADTILRYNRPEIVGYPSIEYLILNELNIDLDRLNALKDSLSFYFELGYGKINELKIEQNTVSGSVECKGNALEYVLAISTFNFTKDEHARKEISLSENINKINCQFNFQPERIDAMLVVTKENGEKIEVDRVAVFLKENIQFKMEKSKIPRNNSGMNIHMEKPTFIGDPTIGHGASSVKVASEKNKKSFQDNIVFYILAGIFILVVGGLILNAFTADDPPTPEQRITNIGGDLNVEGGNAIINGNADTKECPEGTYPGMEFTATGTKVGCINANPNSYYIIRK